MLKYMACLSLVIITFIHCGWAVGNETTSWRRFAFNGREFHETAQPAKTTIHLKNGCLPDIVAGDQAPREDLLPEGTGGVAGLCYLDAPGGKQKVAGGYVPLPGASIELSKGKWRMAVRADAQGYFVLALPPGDYEIKLYGFSGTFRIEKGKNTLVAIRG
jgi:hypothetical protein